MTQSFPETYGDRWKDAREIYYQAYRGIHLDLLTPHQGAEEILLLLKQHNVYMAIVSNKSGDNLRKEVNHLNWGQYFEEVVGANDTSYNKPNREPLIKALSGHLGDWGKDIWFIGDSPIDMACAKEIRATALYVGLPETLKEAQLINPDLYHFGGLKEVMKAIENLLIGNG